MSKYTCWCFWTHLQWSPWNHVVFSCLWTSYTFLQATQLRLIRPQLVSKWLASYFPHDCPFMSHIGSSPPFCFDARCTLASCQGSCCQAPASHFKPEAPHPPATLPTFPPLILGEFPLEGILQVIFPGDCKLQHDDWPWGFRHDNDIWSQDAEFLLEAKIPADVLAEVPGCSLNLRKVMACFEGPLNSSGSWMDLIVAPLLVPWAATQDMLSGWSLRFHVCNPVWFHVWNPMWHVLSIVQPMSPSSQAHCHTMTRYPLCSIANIVHDLSPFLLILPPPEPGTASPLLLGVSVWELEVGKDLGPTLPQVTSPTSLLGCNLDSACWTASTACHFLPVLT